MRPDWITLVDEETAIAKARAAPRGPLYGIPFAVKDNIDVAGLPTTCACPAFAYVAERSATVVERLEQAGAILIGKTNLDQFATGLNGTRSPYGIPTSTFNPDYISGGSSSGSAVAVAAGLVSFALGTDTAGSGRVPAAFNNIVGLKPTKGLISMRGVVPACRTQDTVSILALTVADAAQSRRGSDRLRRGRSLRARRSAALSPWNRRHKFQGLASRMARSPSSATRITSSSTARRSIVWRPLAPRSSPSTTRPSPRRRRCSMRDRGSPSDLPPSATLRRETPTRSTRSFAASFLARGARRRVETFNAFYDLAARCVQQEREWAKIDVLLLPTAGTTFKIAEMLADPVRLNTELGTYTNFVNLMDLAAIAVPAGFRPMAFPFGVTLIGPALSDGMLAALGDVLHRSLADAKLGATSFSLSSTSPVRIDVKPTKVKTRRRRRASLRSAAQRPTHRAKGETHRDDVHRPGLSPLCAREHSTCQARSRFRWHRCRRHRGRDLGDG